MQHFWPAVADGSWLMEVYGASHNTFLRAPWLVQKALDLLCKRGPASHEVGLVDQTSNLHQWYRVLHLHKLFLYIQICEGQCG